MISLRRLSGWIAIGLLLSVDVFATGVLGGSERALAVARTIVLPGIAFFEWQAWLGAVTVVVAISALVAWLKWGIDWLVVMVIAFAVATALWVMPLHHDIPVDMHEHATRAVTLASHEFTIVLVIFAILARMRLMFSQLPGTGWLLQRLPEGWLVPVADTARAAALTALADGDSATARDAAMDPCIRARTERVNRWARFRHRGDAFRRDHAHARAALALTEGLDADQIQDLRANSRASLAGVPASEPTWVRPLDGMLVALALDRLGESACVARWLDVFERRFGLHHGRRSAALHTPSMLGIGTLSRWEHAAATALGRRAGWLDDGDWKVLRPRCLGAATGSARDAGTTRLIAAGRLWAALVRDEEARLILERPGIGEDGLAQALNRLALQELATVQVSASARNSPVPGPGEKESVSR